jgi:NAD(P)-dependent dehydrogenase (short-subunit alcohol dehydrogenase family)
MDGRTVVITGGNAGLGKATAVDLAEQGARVVITARDPRRGREAVEEIRARSGSKSVEVMGLDLADLASVRDLASGYTGRYDRLDVLINNAGLVQRTRTETADGFETTFGVNHLGHFLLTQLLLDQVRASAPSRIVVVSSDAHRSARKGLAFDDLMSERSYAPFGVYAKSKLANIYFARELARRLEDNEVTANAIHPGFVASRFGRDGDGGMLADVAMVAGRPFASSPEKGARTSVFLASSPEVDGVSGAYFARCREKRPSAVARDDEAARRLWAISEELVAARR